MPKAAPQIGDRRTVFSLLGKAGQHSPVERLSGELVAEALQVLLGDSVITLADSMMLRDRAVHNESLHRLPLASNHTPAGHRPVTATEKLTRRQVRGRQTVRPSTPRRSSLSAITIELVLRGVTGRPRDTLQTDSARWAGDSNSAVRVHRIMRFCARGAGWPEKIITMGSTGDVGALCGPECGVAGSAQIED